MNLQWQEPTHSMHGDMVELIAPYGDEQIEVGMYAGGDPVKRGCYYVCCCDHEANHQRWTATLPSRVEAQAYAEQRVVQEIRQSPVYTDEVRTVLMHPFCRRWAAHDRDGFNAWVDAFFIRHDVGNGFCELFEQSAIEEAWRRGYGS